jgi:thioredoxin-like negative regulator of GroEL
MKRQTIIHTVFFFLLIFSSDKLYSADLYEEQIYNLGQSYELNGKFKKALNLYTDYLANNDYSERIAERLNIVKKFKRVKKPKSSYTRNIQKETSVYALQVLTTKSAYRKAAEREKRKFERYGLSCYLKEGRNLYLRCNPSENRSDLEDGIAILEDRNKDYFIVKDTINFQKNVSKPRPTRVKTKKIERPKRKKRVRPPRKRKPETKPVQVNNDEVENQVQDEENNIAERPKRPKRPHRSTRPKRPSKKIDKEKAKKLALLQDPRKRKKPLKKKKVSVEKSKFTLGDGYQALNSKQLGKAKKIFGDILKYSPKDIDANFGYALVFMNEGDWTKAYIILKKIINLTDRKDIHKTFKSVKYNMYLKKGWKNVANNPAKAADFFKKAQTIENTPDVAEGLAYAFNNDQKYDQAIPEMLRLFKERHDFKTANMVIDAYLKAKKKAKAREFFNSLSPTLQANMKYNPKREELLVEVEKYYDSGLYRKARNVLKELYLMFPTDMKVLLYFAKVYEAEKRYKNALEYYKTILSKDALNEDSLMGVARIYAATKKYKQALSVIKQIKENGSTTKKLEAMEKDIKLKMYIKNNNKDAAMGLAKELLLDDPTNTELYILLGDMCMEDSKNRDAYFYYGRAFQLAPNDFDIRMKLLSLLLEQNLFDQTQTLLSKFKGFKLTPEQRIKLRDFYLKFYKKYTASSLEEKDYEYALKAAKSGLKMEPDDTFFIESAGWAGLNSKRYNDAIFYFSKILSKSPKNWTIRYGMGLAYVNLKQFDKAREYFKSAEASNDIDLLYKIAEIYKDTGFKKDSYRVIKLIEELGRRKLVKTTTDMPQQTSTKTEKKQAPVTNEISTSSQSSFQVDELNTFNPFIIGESGYQASSVSHVPDPTLTQSLPDVVPEADTIKIKKKNGSKWF